MNNRMFDSTIQAISINLGAIKLAMDRIKNLPVSSGNYEEFLKRDLDEISTLTMRVDELTIVAKACIEIG